MRNRSAIHKGHIAFASPLCLGRQPVQTFGNDNGGDHWSFEWTHPGFCDFHCLGLLY